MSDPKGEYRLQAYSGINGIIQAGVFKSVKVIIAKDVH